MANGKCSISGCGKTAVARANFRPQNAPEGVPDIIELKLCPEHGEAMRRAYFPDAPPVKNPCTEIPIDFEVTKK